MAEPVIQLTHKEFLKVDRNYEKAALVVNLIYVKDAVEGICRVRKGKGFSYLFDGKPLRDKKEIQRIRKLAIPPAWTKVWICPMDNGHIQATGLDLRQRKQYKYHIGWNQIRHETKFHRLYEFGKALATLRSKLDEDLQIKNLSQEKVIATAISLMERTYIRIGNSGYEKMYGSYGLTTLKNKHVDIKGDKIVFSFKGKKGIQHRVSLRNKRLARTVKECRDIPGKELFQYYDEEGHKGVIDSGMVNGYLKSAMGSDFTAKDFRTWAGSVQALLAFQSVGGFESETECKKNILQALDLVSSKLGNTRTVCKKYYVHPALIQLYTEDKLLKLLQDFIEPHELPDEPGLSEVEGLLMKILKNVQSSVAGL